MKWGFHNDYAIVKFPEKKREELVLVSCII
jgi:hypothetical protein